MTKIETVHEESYSDGRTLGILLNYERLELGMNEKINSFVYLFREEMYIFFETIVDMNDYLLYGDKRVKRAYMKEEDFDNFYDNGLETPFEEVLNWT